MKFIDRKIHLVEVVFWSLMVGFGEAYIGAYALASGFSEAYAGLITALPLALASLFQLFSSRLLPFLKCRRHFVVICAIGQAFMLWLVAGHGLFDGGSPMLLILVLTMYWLFGLSAGPVWNSWVVAMLRPEERLKFFAKRGPYHEISVLTGLLLAGLLLSFFKGKIIIFVLLFMGAGLFRLISAYSLYQTPDEPGDLKLDYASPADFKALVKWLTSKKVIRILAMLSFFNFGVYLGAPFFTPFMLKQMGFSYHTYMFLIAIPFVSRALSYGFFERVARKVGLTPIILPAMLAIASIPILWVSFSKIEALILFQVLSGIAWTGFEYGVLLKQISDFGQSERSRVLAWNNFFVGIFTILGVGVGSIILSQNPTMKNYENLFMVSSIFRFWPVPLFFFVDWSLPQKAIRRIYVRMVGLRVGRGGAIAKPVLYTENFEK